MRRALFICAVFASLALFFSGCKGSQGNANADVKTSATHEPEAAPAKDQTKYRSDYFVFVGEDADRPLIIPVDINWEPRADRETFIELKAWRGESTDPWPMRYVTESRPVSAPSSWKQLDLGPHFRYAEGNRTLSVDVQGKLLELALPETQSPVEHETPFGGSSKVTVARTTADGDIPGWLIHEEVRLNKLVKKEGAVSPFGVFHWFVLGDPESGDFYLFIDNDSADASARQYTAVRWHRDDRRWSAERSEDFTLEILDVEEDKESARERVPRRWKISAPGWGIEDVLEVGPGHTGYGGAKPSGKALYKQAWVKGGRLHGMIELILED